MKGILAGLAITAVALAMNTPRRMGMGLLSVSTGTGIADVTEFALRGNPAAYAQGGHEWAGQLTEYAYLHRLRSDGGGFTPPSKWTYTGVGYPVPEYLRGTLTFSRGDLGRLMIQDPGPAGLGVRGPLGPGVLHFSGDWAARSERWVRYSTDTTELEVTIRTPWAGLDWAGRFGNLAVGAGGFLAAYASELVMDTETFWLPGGRLGALAELDAATVGVSVGYIREDFGPTSAYFDRNGWRFGVNAAGRTRDGLNLGLRGGWDTEEWHDVNAENNPWAMVRAGFEPTGRPWVFGAQLTWAEWGQGSPFNDEDSVNAAIGAGWRGSGLFAGAELDLNWRRLPSGLNGVIDAAQTLKAGLELGRGWRGRVGGFFSPRQHLTPDEDTYRYYQWGITAGVGAPVGPLQVDAGYVFASQVVEHPSEWYGNFTHEVALGLTYSAAER